MEFKITPHFTFREDNKFDLRILLSEFNIFIHSAFVQGKKALIMYT